MFKIFCERSVGFKTKCGYKCVTCYELIISAVQMTELHTCKVREAVNLCNSGVKDDRDIVCFYAFFLVAFHAAQVIAYLCHADDFFAELHESPGHYLAYVAAAQNEYFASRVITSEFDHFLSLSGSKYTFGSGACYRQ